MIFLDIDQMQITLPPKLIDYFVLRLPIKFVKVHTQFRYNIKHLFLGGEKL